MNTHENSIYANNIINSENSEDLAHLYSEEDLDLVMNGGAGSGSGSSGDLPKANSVLSTNRPTGGFPPIFIIDETKEKELEKINNRQFATNKTTVSIRDILKNKK